MFLTAEQPPGDAQDPDEVARLEQLLDESNDALGSGDHAIGSERARKAAELAEQLGMAELLAHAYLLWATHDFRLGETESSLAAGHRALALFTELEDLGGMSSALNGMVMAFDALGLQEEALEHAGRSLEAAKQSGDPLTLAWAYNRAGISHASVGNSLEGVASLEFALSLAREVGDEEAVFAALNNLIGDLNRLIRSLLSSEARQEAAERIERALELAPEALEFARASGNPYEEAIILLTSGQTLALAGEHERATETLNEAEELAQSGGYRTLLIEARYEKARLELDRGDLQAGIERYQALLGEAEVAGSADVMVNVHLELWRAYKQQEDFRSALEHHERFHELEREQQSQMAKTRARVLSTHLELDRAQLEARRATLEAELERSRTRELEAQARALRQEHEVLSRRADQDGLTGLWNRRHIERELPRLIREAGVREEPLSVAFVDADHFKSINDRFGHLVGDDVLRRLAELLRRNVRPTDVVARMGGEEFVVLLPGAAGDAAVVLGQRLCDAMREATWADLVPGVAPTVSVGVASSFPGRLFGRDLSNAVAALLGEADEALYAAKRAGRNRVVLAELSSGVVDAD